MDYQIESSIRVTTDFYKMIASAQRTDAAPGAFQIDVRGAAKPGQVNFLVQRMMNNTYPASAGNFCPDQRIKRFKINFFSAI